MGSPNLSTKNCNPVPLPLPNNNIVIISGKCIGYLYEHIPVHFPWKANTNSFYVQLVFICVHVSCLIRAFLLKHGLIKNTLYRLSYSFSFSPHALIIFCSLFCLFYVPYLVVIAVILMLVSLCSFNLESCTFSRFRFLFSF